MAWVIRAVTTTGKVLQCTEDGQEVAYYDLGDAAGDIDGGDYFTFLQASYPKKKKVKIKEYRLICDEPYEIDLMEETEEDHD